MHSQPAPSPQTTRDQVTDAQSLPARHQGGSPVTDLPPDQSLPRQQDGSLVTEYGLIAIVGATIASLVVKWATGGAIWKLFDAVTDKVRVLLGS